MLERTLQYEIAGENAGFRISQYLRHIGFSRQNLMELKKFPDSVLLNGSVCYLNRILSAGDLLTVRIRETKSTEKLLPVELPFGIAYEDEDLLVVDKPAGMPTHPSMKNENNSLANALAFYYERQGRPFVFRCTNRLDRDTSGLTVVAKHMLCGNLLSSMGIRHEISREYLAIVYGHVEPDRGRIEVPLGRKPGSIIERIPDPEHGEHAATNYRVVEYVGDHTLLALTLETGRTHQIRIHMKYLGYPLIGDYLYYPDMRYIGRQALHSARLSFRHPITGEQMGFTSPLPEDMADALRKISCSGKQLKSCEQERDYFYLK